MVYQLSRGGQIYGPYTIEDLQRYLASGNVASEDLVKGDADSGWITVARLLNPGVVPPPPRPVSSNPFATAPLWSAPAAYAAPAPEVKEVYEYRLFPVSTTKFLVMSLVTLGLYQVYWSYKNWARIETENKEDIMPWARAIFLGIWNFSLFERVKARAANEEIPVGWNPVVLGISVLLFAVISRLPHGISGLALFSFLPYLPVIQTIARINAKYASVTEEQPNSRFSAWNVAGIVVGGIVVFLVVLGSLMEATGAAKPH